MIGERDLRRFRPSVSLNSVGLVTQMSVLYVVDQLLQGAKLNAASIEFARI